MFPHWIQPELPSLAIKKIPKSCICLLAFGFLLFGRAHAGEMVLIPGGEFEMGSEAGKADERPAHKVYLDPFYLDRYPVTNADYARFLNVCGNHKEDGKKWLDTDSLFSWWLCKIKFKDGRFIPKKGYERHPVVKVSWYGARAYAKWVGKRLPTEAEWEKAARGDLIGKRYVFGNTLTPNQANIQRLHATTPVGQYPPNGFGLYDLVAHVWQWCSDWYDPEYYPRSPYKNPQGPTNGTLKILRGGSWYHEENWMVSNRGADSPISDQLCFVTGFRCAKDVDTKK
jgi:formylglycine-generating enzyme required for sulfatase activity